MNRRALIKSLLGTAAVPGILLLSGSATQGVSVLSAAWARAKGRPIVVLVIQEDLRSSGTTLGVWLRHHEDAQALLGGCEVVAATREQIELFAPHTPKGPASLVVIRTDVVGAVPVLVHPETEEASISSSEGELAQIRNEERLTHALRQALPAAVVAEAQRHRQRNIDRAQELYVTAPPPGAKWAVSYGCGTQVEGEPPVGIGCGMGHVPERSRRFLYFYKH